MTGRQLTDAQISKALRAHLPDRAYPGLRERILDRAETTTQQWALPSFLGALNGADPVTRRRSLLIAAALLVALALASAAAVGALRLLQRDTIQDLSFEPPVGPSPSASTAPLNWSRASLGEDWPAPVRVEPAGGAIVRPILLNVVWIDAESCCKSLEFGQYSDPTGDTGSDVLAWADIHVVSFCKQACLEVWVPGPPPNVDPTEQWVAYGLVVDDDGDGVADRRFGIDNTAETTAGEREQRTWITDLHTGRTVSATGDSAGLGDTIADTSYPAAGANPPSCSASSARLNFGGDLTGGGTFGAAPARFYAWSSVIVGGRVVATDFAPDTGWLQPSSEATPTAPRSDEVAPPIDSAAEAIAAVGLFDFRFLGFEPGEPNIFGTWSRVQAEARGDGWDLTFVCGSGDCSAGCINRANTKFHVRRDGTVDPSCEWQEGDEAAGTPC